MAQGKAKSVFLDTSAGMVGLGSTPDWSFIYEASTIKPANWNIGDHVKLPDGREYVLAKSSAACYSAQAVETTAIGVVGTQLSVAAAIGDKSVTVAAATHDALAKDALRGGYLIVHYIAGINFDEQVRGIIGNDVSAANAAIKVYLDGPLTTAVTTSGTLVEVFQNPFAAVRKSSLITLAKLGVPAVYVSAANMYFWVQTQGPTFVAPQSGVVNGQLGAFWRNDGSLQDANTALTCTVLATYGTSQYAGYTLEGNYSGNGPLFMLRC